MNIAIFTDTYLPDINGVAASVFTLAEELEKRGHKVYIFTGSKEKKEEKEETFYQWASDLWQKAFSEILEEKPIRKVYRLPSLSISFLKPHRMGTPISLNAFRMMKKLDIDIVHTQTEFLIGFLGMSMASAYRLPVVHTYHTMYEDYTHYIAKGTIVTPEMARSYSKFFCNQADCVVAPTRKTLDHLRSYGVKRDIHTIPTGINLEPFSKESHPEEEISELRRSMKLAPEVPVILFLGRMAKEKSIDILLSKMPMILEKIPNAKLLLVGTGPAEEDLRKMANTLGIEESVIFAGRVPYTEVGKYYQLGDVFVSCSTSETQGLTYYEAIAAGVPVLARRDESIEDFFESEKNCLLFDDEDTLPELLVRIMEDKALSKKLSIKASEGMAEISSQCFGQRIEDVYMNAIDKEVIRRKKKNHSIKTKQKKTMRQRLLRSKAYTGRIISGTTKSIKNLTRDNKK